MNIHLEIPQIISTILIYLFIALIMSRIGAKLKKGALKMFLISLILTPIVAFFIIIFAQSNRESYIHDHNRYIYDDFNFEYNNPFDLNSLYTSEK
jgi:hypothetical protein